MVALVFVLDGLLFRDRIRFWSMYLGGDVVVDVVVAIVGMGAVWGGDIHGTISFRRVLNGKHLVGCVLKGERFPLVVPLLLLEHM